MATVLCSRQCGVGFHVLFPFSASHRTLSFSGSVEFLWSMVSQQCVFNRETVVNPLLKGQTKLTFTWHTPNRVNIK